MKKTLLAVALLLASTCAFAQVNVANNSKTQRTASVSAQKIDAVKSVRAAKAPEGAISLMEFNDPSTYITGTMYNHTPADYVWMIQPDTNITEANYPFLTGYIGIEDGGWYNTWLVNNEDERGIEASNGFAYIWAEGASNVSSSAVTTFNAWIQAANPISTYGMRGLDIHLGQWGQRFNQDKFYIDWSHDNFATYDSIEINVRNIDLGSNESMRGWKTVNLPNNLDIPVISTDESELTYIRIRYYSPNQPMVNGYFWIIDGVSYSEAPESRIELVNFHWYEGYSMLPSIITPAPLASIATVANTGVNTLNNVKLNNNINSLARNAENTGYDYTFLAANSSSDTNLLSDARVDTETDMNQNEVQAVRRHVELVAEDIPQVSGTAGAYALTSEVVYVDAVTNEAGRTEIVDTISYTVESEMEAIANHYRWGRDLGALVEQYGAFQYGLTSDGYLTDRAAWNTNGYKVCHGFQLAESDAPVYARGVELVPAMDSCRAGAVIKASLLKTDYATATTYDELVVNAVDEDGNAVESFEYTVSAADLNNNVNPNALDVFYDFERTGSDGTVYPAYNTIYLEYNYGATQIEPGEVYYACYEMVGNGRFCVGKDYDGWDRLGTGSYINLLVFSPGSPAAQNYAWGGFFYSAQYADFVAPMIRLVVSPVAASINDAKAETSSVNVYPNPATSHATVNYVLNERGNVNITVTDLMGRTVIEQVEGTREAGVNYNANLNVNTLSNGTYFCTLNVNGTSTTTKLVVNR